MSFTMFHLTNPVVFLVLHLHSSSPCGMIPWIETSQLWIHRAQPAAPWPSSASCGHMLRHRAWVREPRNRVHRHPVAPKKGSHHRNLEVFFFGISDLRWYFLVGDTIWDDTTIKEEWVLISKFSKNHPKPHLIFRKRFYLAKKTGSTDFSNFVTQPTPRRARSKSPNSPKSPWQTYWNPKEESKRLGSKPLENVVGNQTFLTNRVSFFFFEGFVIKVWCARCFYFETQNIELNVASQCLTCHKMWTSITLYQNIE